MWKMKNRHLECGVVDLLLVILISAFVPVKSQTDVAAMMALKQSLNNQLSSTLIQVNKSVSSNGKPDIGNNIPSPAPVISKSSSGSIVVRSNGNPDIGKSVPSPAPEPSGPSTGSGSPAPEPSGSGSPNGTNSVGRHPNSKSSAPVRVIVGSIIGGVFLVFLAGMLGFYFYRRKQKHFGRVRGSNTLVVQPHHFGSNPETAKALSENYNWSSSVPSEIQMGDTGNMVMISIQVLRNATNNFSEDNILGRGGFGTVYKGELDEGTKIAVKRMNSGTMTKKGHKEFKSEIDVLTNVRHRHLVALLGYCLDGNERLLVFEYMPQGTLSRHLFNWKEEGLMPLGWSKRLSIALDVARGVEYLHGLAHQSFIHRDLKPSNILVGDDTRAKVADFGLVRLVPEGKSSIETRLAGTFGYLAPEYATMGRITTKVDVFSFGVILMELITGRKALDETQSEDSIYLVTWFRRMLINKDTFQKAIDPTIDLCEETLASINTVVKLAEHCCASELHQRPDMRHVVNVLSSLAEVWKPSNPDSEDIYGIQMQYQGTSINAKRRRMAHGFISFKIPNFFRNSSLSENSIPSMVWNSV